ncbi:MAG: hypothetical protein LCH95_00010 [Proteobacteria bacterium]|nr:hypothetical protein [Pseudomonadota bacterium]
MAIFFAIIVALPIALAEFVDWRYAAAFWAVLFLGSGLLKLLGLGF